MSDLCRLIWCALIGLFRPRAALEAEILVLRHQLNILRRKCPKRVAVLVGNSCSDILVVQAAQDGHGECLTDGLDGARNRRVLLQRQMRAGLVVIFLI
jgi:hypothetical protein